MTRPATKAPTLLAAFRDRYRVPALGAAIIGADGAVEVHVAGTRRRGGEALATADDSWHIGSCGKSMTAALHARLVELGLTSWGLAVRELFPDLARDVHVGWSTPTIDDVLVCRSGIRANLGRGEMRQAYDDTRPATDQRSRVVVAALSCPPDRRGHFRYSNLGYIVAGAAIERITGLPFEDALRVYLLDPLGMTSAGYGPPPVILGHGPQLQAGALCLGQGAPVEPDDVHSDNPPVLTAAGRLHLTLADWARFHQLFLEGSGLLGPESIDRLLTLPADGRGMAMGWASAARIEGVSHGMQGSNTRWAATALLSSNRDWTSMVVTNDGRTRVLAQTAHLAAALLTAPRGGDGVRACRADGQQEPFLALALALVQTTPPRASR